MASVSCAWSTDALIVAASAPDVRQARSVFGIGGTPP
jgi:hypothetical protein